MTTETKSVPHCFKNDDERLEKLIDLYTKMTTEQGAKTRERGARS